MQVTCLGSPTLKYKTRCTPQFGTILDVDDSQNWREVDKIIGKAPGPPRQQESQAVPHSRLARAPWLTLPPLCWASWRTCHLLFCFCVCLREVKWDCTCLAASLCVSLFQLPASEEGSEIENWVLLPTKTSISGQECLDAAWQSSVEISGNLET